MLMKHIVILEVCLMTMMESIKKYQRVCGLCGNTFETTSEITKICPFCQDEVARLMKDLPEEQVAQVLNYRRRYGFGL